MGLRAILFVGMLGVLAFWVFDSDSRHDRAGAKELTRDSAVEGTARGEAEQEQIAEPDAELAKSTEPAPRTVRWQILPGELGVPPDGETLRLTSSFGDDADGIPSTGIPSIGIVDGDWLVVHGWKAGRGNARVFWSDDRVAELRRNDDESIGAPTQFVRAYRLEVRILDPRDGAAEWVCISSERQTPAECEPSFEQGRATFVGVPSRYIWLWRSVSPENSLFSRGGLHDPEWIGCVDLESLKGPIEHTSAGEVRIDLRVVGDLPPSRSPYRIRVDGSELSGKRYRFEEARLTGRVPMPRGVPDVELSVWGQHGLVGEVTLLVPAPGGRWTRDLHIRPERRFGNLRFESVPGFKGWGHDCQLRAVSGAGAEAGYGQCIHEGRLVGETRKYLAGDYRLEQLWSGAIAATATVVGGETSVMRIGANVLGWVECWVEAPYGSDRQDDVEVHISGMRAKTSERFEGRLEEGWMDPKPCDSFFFGWANVDAQLRLEVRHPVLAPDPRRPWVDTDTSSDDKHRLRLVRGPVARFALPDGYDKLTTIWLSTPGHAPYRLKPWQEDGAWRFSGYLPGSYTLLAVFAGRAMSLTRIVDLPAKNTDLGILAESSTCAIDLRVLVTEPYCAPNLEAELRRKDPPRTSDEKRESRTGLVRFDRLAAGRYELEFTCGPVRASRVIELDGKTDIEIPIDLRHPDQR